MLKKMLRGHSLRTINANRTSVGLESGVDVIRAPMHAEPEPEDLPSFPSFRNDQC